MSSREYINKNKGKEIKIDAIDNGIIWYVLSNNMYLQINNDIENFGKELETTN